MKERRVFTFDSLVDLKILHCTADQLAFPMMEKKERKDLLYTKTLEMEKIKKMVDQKPFTCISKAFFISKFPMEVTMSSELASRAFSQTFTLNN